MSDLFKKLAWPVEYRSGDTLEVETDACGQRHIVTVPVDNVRQIELQHEAAHCLLAEQVHPLFSGHTLVGCNQAMADALAPVFHASRDWFVDEVLVVHFPAAVRSEVNEHLRLTISAIESGEQSPELHWAASLFAAQARRYGCKKAWRRYRKSVSNAMAMTDLFCRVDPSQPTIQALTRLVNRCLAAATNRTLSVVLAGDVWELVRHD